MERIPFYQIKQICFISTVVILFFSCSTGVPEKITERDVNITFLHSIVDSLAIVNPWTKTFGDIDGDGKADLIIGGQKGPLLWFRNPDWKNFEISEGGYNTVDGEAGDIDGDGDIDLVMGGLFWYENPGGLKENPQLSWNTHQIADHPTHDVELADLNNDGRLDIVTRNQSDFGKRKGNTIHIWINTGDNWKEEVLPCDHGEGLRTADLDNDGDFDIVAGGFWFENGGLEGWVKYRFTSWHGSAHLAIADLNQDGRRDIILTPSELSEQYYKIAWFEQPPDPIRGKWIEHPLADSIECVIHGVEVGDFDQDKKVDIVYSEMHQGTDPDEVVVLLNEGEGKNWKKRIISNQGSHNIEVVDINGDNLPDIFGANWSGNYQPIEYWITEIIK